MVDAVEGRGVQPLEPADKDVLVASAEPEAGALAEPAVRGGESARTSVLARLSLDSVGNDEAADSEDDDLAAQSIRIFERRDDGSVEQVTIEAVEASLKPQQPAVLHSQVGLELVEKAMASASQLRRDQLVDVASAPANATVLPEDLSLAVGTYHLAAASPLDQSYIVELAKIARKEGVGMVVTTYASDRQMLADKLAVAGLAESVAIVSSGSVTSCWTEDNAAMSAGGEISVPLMVEDLHGRLIDASGGESDQPVDSALVAFGHPNALPFGTSGWGQAMADWLRIDRVRRLYPEHATKTDAEILALPGSETRDAEFGQQGQVAVSSAHREAAARAVALTGRVREGFTYIEGGNMLTGTRANGDPYAIIGMDSVALSARLLEAELGRAVDDRELRLMFAKDLGLEPEHVIYVEQPGEFHIDMSMSVMGPGQVIVNDAALAVASQAQWMREDHAAQKPADGDADAMAEWAMEGELVEELIAALGEHGGELAQAEARTVADLEAAGLQVERIAGRFFSLGGWWGGMVEQMNFLNGEGGTNVRGQKFFVTQGGDPRAEDYVVGELMAKTGLDRIYFMDRELAEQTLMLNGALSCRVRTDGHVVSHGSSAV